MSLSQDGGTNKQKYTWTLRFIFFGGSIKTILSLSVYLWDCCAPVCMAVDCLAV